MNHCINKKYILIDNWVNIQPGDIALPKSSIVQIYLQKIEQKTEKVEVKSPNGRIYFTNVPIQTEEDHKVVVEYSHGRCYHSEPMTYIRARELQFSLMNRD